MLVLLPGGISIYCQLKLFYCVIVCIEDPISAGWCFVEEAENHTTTCTCSIKETPAFSCQDSEHVCIISLSRGHRRGSLCCKGEIGNNCYALLVRGFWLVEGI